jgi:hypothetical protein
LASFETESSSPAISEEDEELKIESLPTSDTLPTNNSSEGKKFLNIKIQ